MVLVRFEFIGVVLFLLKQVSQFSHLYWINNHVTINLRVTLFQLWTFLIDATSVVSIVAPSVGYTICCAYGWVVFPAAADKLGAHILLLPTLNLLKFCLVIAPMCAVLLLNAVSSKHIQIQVGTRDCNIWIISCSHKLVLCIDFWPYNPRWLKLKWTLAVFDPHKLFVAKVPKLAIHV